MKGHSLEAQNHCSLKSYTVEMKKILVLTNSAKISKLIIQFCNGGTFWEISIYCVLQVIKSLKVIFTARIPFSCVERLKAGYLAEGHF